MSGKTSAPTTPRGTTPASDRGNPARTAAPPLPTASKNAAPPEEAVRARAYALWELAGWPEGDGQDFWFRAEKELSNPR